MSSVHLASKWSNISSKRIRGNTKDRSSSGCDGLLSSRTLRCSNQDRILIWRQNLLLASHRELNQQIRHRYVRRDRQTSKLTLALVSIPCRERQWIDIEPGRIPKNLEDELHHGFQSSSEKVFFLLSFLPTSPLVFLAWDLPSVRIFPDSLNKFSISPKTVEQSLEQK